MQHSESTKLFEEAKRYIPGGVNSPVRAFKAVKENPPFIVNASGSKIYDADGNEYIDYVSSWGPAIVGHANPKVSEALKLAIDRGTSYGAPTPHEVELAKLVIKAYPSMDMVRMVNSGTEATMSALRLARGYTKRDYIIKFAGCYHGHSDFLLVKAGSGATTFGVPNSPGVPEGVAQYTYTASFNNLSSVESIMEKDGENVAAIILEPVPGNMGVITPKEEFLKGLREICDKYKTLLIFDEVMSGFRVAYGGAQALYSINPDMTCLGKIIGGGLPVGAFGGRNEIMSLLAPEGPVYQAGTLSGNPLAMTAGIETLKVLKDGNIYEELEEKTSFLCSGLKELAQDKDIPTHIGRVGSMFTLFFTAKTVQDYEDALNCNLDLFSAYHKEMLNRGIYLPPSQFEAIFLSSSHSMEDIEKTLKAAEGAL
ncbi:MAG: glutamate-1-semialdehyde 2,1-aminomutase, partial [Thermodesulfobacteriota bacterium]